MKLLFVQPELFFQFPLLGAGVESGRGPAVIPKIKFLTTEVPYSEDDCFC